MIKKFRLVGVVFGCLAVAALSSAQTAGSGGATTTSTLVGGKGKGNRLQEEKTILGELGLTTDQNTKVLAAWKTRMDAAKALRKSEKAEKNSPVSTTPAGESVKDERKEKMKEINKTFLGSLKSILTPGQWIKYKELHKELRKENKAAKAVTP